MLTLKMRVNYNDLNQGLLHLWSIFGDPSLNKWWFLHGQVKGGYMDEHTDRQTQAMTIPKGQNWPCVKIILLKQLSRVPGPNELIKDLKWQWYIISRYSETHHHLLFVIIIILAKSFFPLLWTLIGHIINKVQTQCWLHLWQIHLPQEIIWILCQSTLSNLGPISI